MRYRLHEHPAFPGLLSKEDLFLLVERGSLARGDLCADTATGRDHTVGDVIGGMRAPGAKAGARIDRPLFREFRADAPGDEPPIIEEEEEPLENEDLEEIASEDEVTDEDTEEPAAGKPVPIRYTPAGELILYQAHPSWLGAGRALFLVLLLLITTGMLIRIEPEYAFVSLLCAGCLLLIIAIARMTRDYQVTEERVEVVWGLIGRSSKEVRICDIRSMDVYERGLKGMLGLGTVDFSSAANAGIEVSFRDIRGAHEVKELVRQLQRDIADRD